MIEYYMRQGQTVYMAWIYGEPVDWVALHRRLESTRDGWWLYWPLTPTPSDTPAFARCEIAFYWSRRGEDFRNESGETQDIMLSSHPYAPGVSLAGQIVMEAMVKRARTLRPSDQSLHGPEAVSL